ncbi:MAG: hypothetical protein EOO47_27190 [Flavobacterium sp.]|nr:MAG: hypothetical protein EOO47_27190 [Flavobacterium sp.]
MEGYEIELAGDVLTVKPQEDGSFEVFNGNSRLGNLTPKIKDDLTNEWLSSDLIGYDYAQQIGELIFEREL